MSLDYVSCLLTIVSTTLIGKRLWYGWPIAGANSILICVIAFHTSQIGFIPANVFCVGIYMFNMHSWRKQQVRASLKTERRLTADA